MLGINVTKSSELNVRADGESARRSAATLTILFQKRANDMEAVNRCL
jgi:hypothetical protein